ncbi:MAG: metal-dependent hydrolase [Candidatus Hodarchaeales archaeon]
MNNRTHFWFAFCLLMLDVIFNSPFTALDQLILVLPIASISMIALLPNMLDSFFSADSFTYTRCFRSRHPLTHSPLVLLSFILLPTLFEELAFFSYAFFLCFLAYASHLFLDLFSDQGIPLGFVPTLFLQDKTKHYTYNDVSSPRLRLVFPFFHFSRNDPLLNSRVVHLSQVVLLLSLTVPVIDFIQNPVIDQSAFYLPLFYQYGFQLSFRSLFTIVEVLL